MEAVLKHCPQLKHLHCNTCPGLTDLDLASAIGAACLSPCSVRTESLMECFYIYEAPSLTVNAFELLIDGFPRLQKIGNITRWAINCEGMQKISSTIRENNLDVAVLCGSHRFTSNCAESVHL